MIVLNTRNNLFKEIREDVETAQRHLTIIESLMKEQPAGIIKIAQTTGIPEHKIRYSLRILERDGIITPSREGAMITPEFLEQKQHILLELREILKDLSAMEDRVGKSFFGKK
jgi:Uncharacterized protein conserved in archaea